MEIDAISSHLEGKNTELMGKLAALESIVAQVHMGGSSVEPPGLAGLDGLKSTVAAIEEQFCVTLPKVSGIDEAQNNVQRKMLDLSRDFEGVKTSMYVEMDQMKTCITEGFASLQHSAAAAQQAQTAADPRGVDPFTVHGGDWQRGRSPSGAEQVYLGTEEQSALKANRARPRAAPAFGLVRREICSLGQRDI